VIFFQKAKFRTLLYRRQYCSLWSKWCIRKECLWRSKLFGTRIFYFY